MTEHDTDITAQPDGPYIVRELPLLRRRTVVTEHGEPITTETTAHLDTRAVYALCRCGQSANKPFCDGAPRTRRIRRHRRCDDDQLRRTRHHLLRHTTRRTRRPLDLRPRRLLRQPRHQRLERDRRLGHR